MTDWPFANPVLTASGCGGTGRDLAAYGDLGALGGFVTRSVTRVARPGGDPPRLVESPSGLVNAIGLQNPGVEAFLRDELPPLLDSWGGGRGEHRRALAGGVRRAVAHRRTAPGVTASRSTCPLPIPWEADCSTPGSRSRPPAWSAPVAVTSGPVWCCSRRSAATSPASSRWPGRSSTRAPMPSWSATPCLPPCRMVAPAGSADRRSVHRHSAAWPRWSGRCLAPGVGCGGIMDAADARAFLTTGARAVQIGTALFHDPTTAFRIAEEWAEQIVTETGQEPDPPAGGDT